MLSYRAVVMMPGHRPSTFHRTPRPETGPEAQHPEDTLNPETANPEILNA